jgi:hypothetical protein
MLCAYVSICPSISDLDLNKKFLQILPETLRDSTNISTVSDNNSVEA